MSGFQDAGVTKGIMLFLGVNSLAASLLDIKPYFQLQLVPHITKYHQLWRVLVHPFVFANSTELLMGELLLYNVGVGIERAFGSRKYASFVLISSCVSTIFSSIAIILFHRLGLNSTPAGPYGVVFSLLWQQYRTIPSLYAFRLLGLEFSSKVFSWVLASQLFLFKTPSSILAAISGLFAGWLYRTDTLLTVPFLSRRRVARPLKSYRIPLSIHLLFARIFDPLVGFSAPPRRANRVLPGQVSDSPARTTAVAQPILRGLLAGRMGEGAVRRTSAGQPGQPGPASRPPPNPVSPAGARAAMGEWVSAMAGRGEGGARPPTEEEISSLSSMFPNLGRETVVRALQRSDHNTALAVEALLEENT